MSYIKIEHIVQLMCESAAKAMRRWHEVSGLGAEHFMPEQFLGSFIFDDLGSIMTMSLEAPAKKLADWDADAARAIGAEIEALEEVIQGEKIDMVLFEQTEPMQPKNDQRMLALVEFKKLIGKTDDDRIKLLRVLANLGSCKLGVTAGAGTLAELDFHRKSTIALGEQWFQSQTPAIKAEEEKPDQFIGARLFSLPAA